MTDPRTNKLAHTIVNYSAAVQKDDFVIIRPAPFCTEALPLYRELFREILRAGGHPHILMSRGWSSLEEQMAYIYLTEASEEQLRYVDPLDELAVQKCDSHIIVKGMANTTYLSGVPAERIKTCARAYSGVREIHYRRWDKLEELDLVVSLYPTSGLAQNAEMSLEAYEDFVYGCTYADTEDPVQEWQRVHDFQQRLVDWLAGKRQVMLRGPNVDLQLSLEGRNFINSHGLVNMPSGEVFTSPVEESAQGWVRFSYPAVHQGQTVEGIELHFEDGKVVQASAKRGEDLLHQMLDVDPGASYLGELGIGTNKKIDRFTRQMLLDEKMGGTIHLAIGMGFAQAGGKNDSSVHWDMLCDMRDGGQIFVDGELFYESGEFLVG